MDFNADKHAQKIIRELCDNWNNPIKNKLEYLHWKNLTERLLREKSIGEVINIVLKISEGLSDKEFESEYPLEIFFDNEEENMDERISPSGIIIETRAKQIIDEKLKITNVAQKYGLRVVKNKAICPFHDDTDPSLCFSDEKNLFFCHGCHTKGNLISFIQKMEAMKKNGKKRS